MKLIKTRSVMACTVLFAVFSFPVSLLAQQNQSMADEMAGTGDVNSPQVEPPNFELHADALAAIPAGGLLLIPESTNDRIMAFDPLTGDLVDADFIPSDATNLSTPIEALLSPDGSLVYVSDQIEDVVQAYDVNTGSFVGTFAPAGGVDTNILDNIRGMAFRPNGNLLVSVGGGSNDDAIAEFDSAGNFVGNFVASGAGGLNSPFDVFAVKQAGGLLNSGDFLVPGITSDAIHRYDSSGAAQTNFASLDTFGEQIAQASNGNVLVANFSGTQEGIVEFTPAGALVGIYDPQELGEYRGVYELPNGNLLVTNGTGVHEIGRSGDLVRTVMSGVSARFISLIQGTVSTATRATFKVSKVFSDGNHVDEVNVSLDCNTGLILDQDKSLGDGEWVEFVVTGFTSGILNCTITEDYLAGYEGMYFNLSSLESNSESCAYTKVENNDAYECEIVNHPSSVELQVTKEWVFESSSASDIDTAYTLTLYCDAEILNGYQFGKPNILESTTDQIGLGCGFNGSTEGISGNGKYYDWCKAWSLDGEAVATAQVIPEYPDSNCYWVETNQDSAVEVDQSDCSSLTVSAGVGATCTIINTVFYEGIPTLGQYGMALLIMLMLGGGLLGFRRLG